MLLPFDDVCRIEDSWQQDRFLLSHEFQRLSQNKCYLTALSHVLSELSSLFQIGNIELYNSADITIDVLSPEELAFFLSVFFLFPKFCDSVLICFVETIFEFASAT